MIPVAKFTEFVTVRHPATLSSVSFAPGDEVPAWATVGPHVTDGGPAVRPAEVGTFVTAPEGDYDEWTVAELREEIANRNEDRDKVNQVPSKGSKDDLIAALNADDDA